MQQRVTLKQKEGGNDHGVDEKQALILKNLISTQFDIITTSGLDAGSIEFFLLKSRHSDCETFNHYLDKLYQQTKNIELIRAFKLLNDLCFNNFIYDNKINKNIRALDHFLKLQGTFQVDTLHEFIKMEIMLRSIDIRGGKTSLLAEQLSTCITTTKKILGDSEWREILDLPMEQIIPDMYEDSSDVQDSKSELNQDPTRLYDLYQPRNFSNNSANILYAIMLVSMENIHLNKHSTGKLSDYRGILEKLRSSQPLTSDQKELLDETRSKSLYVEGQHLRVGQLDLRQNPYIEDLWRKRTKADSKQSQSALEQPDKLSQILSGIKRYGK